MRTASPVSTTAALPGRPGLAAVRRAGVAVGLVFGALLVLSRALLAGRPVSFWLENTAGVWFVAAFVAGALTRRPAAGRLAGAGALLLALVLHARVWFVTADGFSVQLLPALRRCGARSPRPLDSASARSEAGRPCADAGGWMPPSSAGW